MESPPDVDVQVLINEMLLTGVLCTVEPLSDGLVDSAPPQGCRIEYIAVDGKLYRLVHKEATNGGRTGNR
jgi:hypothetical protein